MDAFISPLKEFNDVVYSGQNRDLICATIVKYGEYQQEGDAYAWTFELVATDPLLPETCGRVAHAFEKIQAAFSIAKLRIRATSHLQIENLNRMDHPLAKYPQIDASAVWGGKTFSCIVAGSVYGTLRYVTDLNDTDTIESLSIDDVAFFASGIPNDLPPVAAVLFADPLPPLCHIAILCHNRQTPCCFDTTQAVKDRCLEFKDQAVLAHWHPMLTQASIGTSYGSFGARNVVDPSTATPLCTPDEKVTAPIKFGDSMQNLPAIEQVGAKARQCCIVNLKNGQMDFHHKSFAIPMGAYIRHTSTKSVKTGIHHLLNRFPYDKSTPFPTIST
jgi:hypothetical protein